MTELAGDQDPRASVIPEGTGATTGDAGEVASLLASCRRRLPSRRWHTIIRFEHKESENAPAVDYDLTIGFYPDGLVGEMFLDGASKQRDLKLKVGSTLEAMLDDQAELCSLLIQMGVRPADLVGRFTQGTILRQAIGIVADVEASGGVLLYSPANAAAAP